MVRLRGACNFWAEMVVLWANVHTTDMDTAEIAALQDKIFEFLYQKYLDARAKGEEFYFLTTDDNAKSLFRQGYKWENKEWFEGDGVHILLTFWRSPHFRNPIGFPLCLTINPVKQTAYLTVEGLTNFVLPVNDANEDTTPRTQPIKEEYQHFFEGLRKVLKMKGEKKEYEGSDYLNIVAQFLENEKPVIDKYVKQYKFESNAKITPLEKDAFLRNVTGIQTFRKSKDPIPSQLPFSLLDIWVRNYKGIESIHIDDIGPNAQWIFLTGENGYGKTLILEAIAIGLYGLYLENDKVLLKEASYIETGINRSYRYDRTFSNYFIRGGGLGLTKEFTRPTLLAYGANRTFSDNKAEGTILHLFVQDMGLPFLAKDWYAVGLNDTPRAVRRFEILKEKMKEIGLLIKIDKDKECLMFSQLMEENEPSPYLPFEDLSAAYKNLFLMIGDIIFKFTNYKNEEKDVLSGIVIIDEFELHLHPKMQRLLVEKLTELFPKVQFIVSTHSPIPLLGAPADSVILHVDRTIEKGIRVERLDEAVGKSVDYMLANVFETPEKYGGLTQKRLDEFYVLRDKMLRKEWVNERSFLSLARDLALKDEQIKTKIQFELQQMRKITGKEDLKI